MAEIRGPRKGSEWTDIIFAHGGDMGDLMRRHDWARTPLGPPEQWPQSLRTGVQIMLGSRYPMFIWWGPALFSLYNDAYCQILGSKHPDALGRPGHEVWPEVWDVVGPLARKVMDDGEATYSDRLLLLMDRSGYVEESYFTFSYSPMPDDSDEIGGVFCAVAEDTARVVSERRLRTLRELATALHQSETGSEAYRAAARALAKNPHDIPFVLLYECGQSSTNARLAAAAGVPEGGPWSPRNVRLNSSSPTDWPFHTVSRHASSIVVSNLDQREPPLPGGPLATIAESAIVLPIMGPGGLGYEGFLVAGISPRRAFDEEYRGFTETIAGNLAAGIATARAHELERERARALVELDRAKSMFFSNASHELRTPLTLMLGPLETLLEQETPSQTEVRSKIDLAHRNGLRLLRLVNNLLDVSRLEGGRLIANRESTNLAAYTVELVSMFDSAFTQAGLNLVIDCPPLEEPVSIDREMWEKIVLNLISNALKFTLDGHIKVSLRESSKGIELQVSDTGVGIPEDELPHIFERFHRVRTPEARTQEGAGIGLALVQELVRLHGGSVRSESTMGAGTTFVVTIPRVSSLDVGRPLDGSTMSGSTRPYLEEALRWLPSTSDVLDTRERANGQALESAREPVARVLVADDNADMRTYLQQLFAADYEVRTAADGAEAVDVARSWAPSIILADIMMPKLDGFGMLRELRLDPQTREIPVIFLSARASENTRVDGLRAGANDYMVKPFSTRELIARVEGHVKLAELRTEVGKQEKDARDRLQRLFEQAPAAICVMDGPQHIVRLANSRFTDLVGAEPTLGSPLLETLPGLGGGIIVEPLDSVYETGAPFIGSAIPVHVERGGEIEQAFFDFVYVPLTAANGDIEGVFLSAYEVTSQVRARGEAESAVKVRDEFLSIAAHELRTPVTGIKGAAQLALRSHQRGTLNSDRLEATLHTIDHAAGRLSGLISDLLDVSRLQAGQMSVRPIPLDIVGLVRDALEQGAFGGTCQIRLETEADRLDVLADEARIEQIIGNLLENAEKYSPDGGIIDVRLLRSDYGVTLEVQDQGIGLPVGSEESIFKPFGRAANASAQNIPGMGLGLYVCRRIAELHNGRLWAQSDGEGRGTTVSLWLPCTGQDLISDESNDRSGAVNA